MSLACYTQATSELNLTRRKNVVFQHIYGKVRFLANRLTCYGADKSGVSAVLRARWRAAPSGGGAPPSFLGGAWGCTNSGHTYASLARRAGGDVRLVQKTMSHASIAVTAHIYPNLNDDMRICTTTSWNSLGVTLAANVLPPWPLMPLSPASLCSKPVSGEADPSAEGPTGVWAP